jgi:hypothetical protein
MQFNGFVHTAMVNCGRYSLQYKNVEWQNASLALAGLGAYQVKCKYRSFPVV